VTELDPGVVVRPLTHADLPVLDRFERELFGAGAWSRAVLAEELEGPGRWYVGVQDPATGALVGYAGLWFDGVDAQVMTIGTTTGRQRRGVGAVLLAGAYALGTINRVHEGGWGYALYARSGFAGSGLFLAVGLIVWGLTARITPLVTAGVVVGAAALVLTFVGLLVEAGGGATGAFQAVVEEFDTVLRLGSNIVSFARLAAFGLTHAALLTVVWQGTTALWSPDWRAAAAVVLFVVGNALTFALEALVAGIQALRLEYYELFSRVFLSEGRPFRPWAPALGAGPASSIHSVGSTEGLHP